MIGVIVLMRSSSSIIAIVSSGNRWTDSRGTWVVLTPRLVGSVPGGLEGGFVVLSSCRLFEK
jgi:hypothetical protein